MRWDLWESLERVDSAIVSKEVYQGIEQTILNSLRNYYGDDVAVYYVFIRDDVKVPRLTVAYLRIPSLSRSYVGLAYCSSLDSPNKWYGRALTLKRAIKNLKNRALINEDFIRNTKFKEILLKNKAYGILTKSLVSKLDWRMFPRKPKDK